MDHEKLLEILTEDITNVVDGAGSDLRFAEATEDGVWIELEGALDISALTNTALAAFQEVLEQVTAERDAALAVIEQASKWARQPERSGGFHALDRILAQSPASALAKVKADVLREAADEMEGLYDAHQWLRTEADRIEKEAGL